MTAHIPKGRPTPSVQDVLAEDSRPAPEILTVESPPTGLGTEDISVERYYSQEWHDMEMEKVWKKVWQMACRVEDIPEVGDHVVYNIGHDSIIVVRTSSDEIKAYVNACLHRGVLLRTDGGRVNKFKCPFHGFTWGLNGELTHLPSEWDFEHIDKKKFCLPEINLAQWGGFVFINLDPDCAPLEDYLEILPEHFRAFPLEDRWKAAHVAKVMPCNWKLALEAFIESFHIPIAHPQTTAYVAWDTTQYDIYPGIDHVNRMLTVEGVPSPSEGEVPPEETVRQMQRDVAFHANSNIEPTDERSVREQFATNARKKLSKSSNKDLSGLSNAEVLDVIEYFLFPNLVPWGGHGSPICYRFRPFENDPEKSVMEIMLLFAKADDGSHPPAPPTIHLGVDDKWADVPEMGSAGFVADQDTENLRRIQKGVRATHKPGFTLANYQESRIRHFHKTLDQYLEKIQ